MIKSVYSAKNTNRLRSVRMNAIKKSNSLFNLNYKQQSQIVLPEIDESTI